MSFNSFIPQWWAAKLLPILENKHNFKVLTNADYEGEIKAGGDSVKINQMSSPSIGSYDRVNGISFEDLSTTSQTLLIDQEDYFAIQVDDIDKAQVVNGGILMSEGVKAGGYEMQDKIDVALAAKYSDAGIIGGSGQGALGTAASVLEITVDGGGSSLKVSEWLARLGRRAYEAKMPDHLPKYVVVPPWLHQKMVMDKLVNPRGVNNDGTYIQGEVQFAYGFGIMVSNNVSYSSTDYRVMGGNRNCITLAQQITHMEPGRRESFFKDYIKALYVYGMKVVRPDQLMLSIVKEGAEGQ